MLDLTFLNNDQIFGKNALEIFIKYGTFCAISDFAILLGGDVYSNYFTREGTALKNRIGWWWNKTSNGGNGAYIADNYGNSGSWRMVYSREGGIRPALPYSSISSISSNGARGINGVKQITYGEYPQTIASVRISTKLEKEYSIGTLQSTGKTYTTDSIVLAANKKSFKVQEHKEYIYEGHKYIRFVADSRGEIKVLSNGAEVQAGTSYWIKVEPITWLVDELANIAITKNIICSGVQFKHTTDYNGDFINTDIKKFLDNYLLKDIIPSNNQFIKTTSQEESRNINPYNFNFNQVSEEDIIRGAIESNVPVFLHGKSGDGKSARVEQLDPDCEIIYIRNASLDSLNGKTVYVPPITKRVARPSEEAPDAYEYEEVIVKDGYALDIKPTWLINIEEKCAKEPDKIHIVFFDELTNADRSVQSMAFNIILKGEVNGKWKLPSNARVVAAGNELEDSIAANEMAEPLFNRFAHVYIKTTVDSWLKWASTPTEKYERLDYVNTEPVAKIHPAIYSYIAYKSFSGQDVLRTKYTGVKPNADPRKWEMASKVLYKTKQPEMLRALVGEAITIDFIAFLSMKILTVEDIINHNYTEKDLEMDMSQKFATAAGLSSVNEENFEVVREFMKQVGAEPKAAFESMWVHGDERRLELLAELQMADNVDQGVKR